MEEPIHNVFCFLEYQTNVFNFLIDLKQNNMLKQQFVLMPIQCKMTTTKIQKNQPIKPERLNNLREYNELDLRNGSWRTCSTTQMPQSSCWRCNIGWRLWRRIRRCSSRSLNGMMMATRSLAIQSGGVYRPPGLTRGQILIISLYEGASLYVPREPTGKHSHYGNGKVKILNCHHIDRTLL